MSQAPEPWDLISRYADGAASRDEVLELERILGGDAGLRREFLRYLNLDSALGGLTGMPVDVAAKPGAPRPFVLRRLSLAAALVAIFLGLIWVGLERNRTTASFATLMATTNSRWSDPNVELALSSGGRVASPLRLESGRAEFRMLDGATVVLDGPANVRFTDRKTVFVDEGRVFCKCPTPESRISVVTPQTKVVDLGTEFSVDARADESTRVAVLSGKVRVLSLHAGVLTAGEVIDVKRAQVVRLQPLTAGEIAALVPEVVPAPPADGVSAGNRLRDPGFEQPLPSPTWRGTDECLGQAASLGRAGHGVRIRAKGNNYPLLKQRVATGDVSGRVVQASVWAMSPAADPLSPRQFAVLKLAFLNAEGREFACSARHFLHRGEPPNVYVPAHLAAQAPAGTCSVEVQLVLAADRRSSGSVCFDDASLVVAAEVAK